MHYGRAGNLTIRFVPVMYLPRLFPEFAKIIGVVARQSPLVHEVHSMGLYDGEIRWEKPGAV